jgi:hypothetical protein
MTFDGRAFGVCCIHVRDDTLFRVEDAAAGLVQKFRIRCWVKPKVSISDRLAVKYFVWNRMFFTGFQSGFK